MSVKDTWGFILTYAPRLEYSWAVSNVETEPRVVESKRLTRC